MFIDFIENKVYKYFIISLIISINFIEFIKLL